MVDFGGGSVGSPDQQRSASVPFEEIVGQDELKEALLAVIADDGLDGLLIRGEKGTAKSTAVRGLVDLLPAQEAVADCPYDCSPTDPDRQCADCRERSDLPRDSRSVPLVTLPLGATQERVVGSLSVADALSGEPEFEPGLLARAHRGILYVDEVNLLDDHLVDVLLDAAATGRNRVERDGVSVTHPAAFTLVGTMNPEEGDLRPQLRDRFALQATVEGCRDVSNRVAIIDHALDTDTADDEPTGEGTMASTAGRRESQDACDRLREARDRLPEVELPASFKREIAELCLDAGVEGHRADIAIARATRVFAALDGRTAVHEPDLERAAALALPHRLQSRPFQDAPDPEELLEEHFDDRDTTENGDATDDGESPDGGDSTDDGDATSGDDAAAAGGDREDTSTPGADPGESDRDDSGRDADSASDGTPGGSSAGERDGRAPEEGPDDEREPVGEQPTGEEASDGHGNAADADAEETGMPLVPGTARESVGEGVAPNLDGLAPTDSASGTAGHGRGDASPSTDSDGTRVRTERSKGSGEIDPAATVRAAATRGGEHVTERDLRQSVRSTTASTLIVVAIDASASMRSPMRAAKGVVLDLLQDAYEARDAVAVVAFAGQDAEVVLPPTESVTLAARHLKELPTADRTPLPAGIETTADVLERAAPDVGVAVVVTDGRATAGMDNPTTQTRKSAGRLGTVADRTIVVDAGDDGRGLTDLLAAETDGITVSLDQLTPERLDRAVGRAGEG
jgi:magnesium chelatase subunit D